VLLATGAQTHLGWALPTKAKLNAKTTSNFYLIDLLVFWNFSAHC
jgi:hypothetical protein